MAQNVSENTCLLTISVRIAGYTDLHKALCVFMRDHCSQWTTGIAIAEITIPVSCAELVTSDGLADELSAHIWWLAANVQCLKSITVTFHLGLSPSSSSEQIDFV